MLGNWSGFEAAPRDSRMDTVNVLSLSHQQMETVRATDAADHNHNHHQHQHHHLHYGMPDGPAEHMQGYVVRDGQHYAVRDDPHMQAVPHYVRDGADHLETSNQQALMAAALAGGMQVQEDHHAVNKLELRWTEQGFCDARAEAGQQMAKEVTGVRWEDPVIYGERGEHVSVMEGAHHVVMQSGEGRWEDSSLCEAQEEEELRNEGGDHLDSKRTREVRWTEQALCDALAAVKSGSITAYKASKDYGIPRSTLRNWLNGRNRSRKRGPRVDEALAFCRQDVATPVNDQSVAVAVHQRGEGASNSADETRLSDGNKEEDSVWKKRRRIWTKQTLFEALNAVRNGELTFMKASEHYGIPVTTLRYWVMTTGNSQERKALGLENTSMIQSFNGSVRESSFGMPFGSGFELNDDEDDEEDEDEDEDEDGEGVDDQVVGEKKERLKKKARDAGKKKVGSWSEKSLAEAMEAIRNGSQTICKASRAFGIPRTTLRNWITGRTRSRKRGPHTGLGFEQGADAVGAMGEDFPLIDSRDDLTPGREEQVEEGGGGNLSGSGQMRMKKKGKGGKWTDQALIDAVEAVRSGSCTISRAGEQFGIPRSTLKYTLHKKSPDGGGGVGGGGGGCEEERGEGLTVESSENNQEQKVKKSNGWTEQALSNAISAIKNGTSIRKAGQCFGIPRTTLRNWLNGRTHSRKRGPHGGMTRGEQETAIVEWFFSVQQVTQSLMSLNSLRRRMATLSVNKGSPFKDGIPVKKWWVWFNRRYPDVAPRVASGLKQSQEQNLSNEMSLVHMVTGEHLQMLSREQQEADNKALVERSMEAAMILAASRGDVDDNYDNYNEEDCGDSSSQEDHEEDAPLPAAPPAAAEEFDEQHLQLQHLPAAAEEHQHHNHIMNPNSAAAVAVAAEM